MYDISKCRKIEIPQGVLYIGPSDETRSVGYLELQPHQSLTLHNRPAIENLTQVKGSCDMVVYHDGASMIHVLHENDTLTIQAHDYHIHTNPYEDMSLTYWDFDGDIREIIQAILEKE